MKMKKLITVLTCVSLGLFSSTGFAKKGINYSYAEFGYVNVDSDAGDSGGFGFNISYAALDFLHIKLGYNGLFDNEDDVSFDQSRILFGIGGNYSVAENVDLTGSVSYVDFETTGDIKTKEDGYLVDIGVRAQASKKVELNATVGSIHLDNEDNTAFSVGGVVKLYKKFSATVKVSQFDIEDGDDDTSIFIGVRLNM